MYKRIPKTMYDGTLPQCWEALVTLQQMIVLSDVDGVIDMAPTAISARTSIPLDIIEKGIAFLSSPVTVSGVPYGSYIKKLNEEEMWGWYIKNHEYYEDDIDTSIMME